MSGRRIWLDRVQLILIILGIGIASYLTYVKLFNVSAYCAGVGDCDTVQNSPYAMLLGVPVAIWGLLGYLAMLGLFLVKRFNWGNLGWAARQAFFLVTLVGLLYSAYLTYLELFVINAICPWCVASAIVLTFLFVLAIVDSFFMGEEDEEDEDELEPEPTASAPLATS